MDVIHLLEDSPALFTAIAGLFGLLVGSFLNVVILRLPVMMEREWRAQSGDDAAVAKGEEPERFNLFTPRSRCPSCGHRITALENIPVLSWLWLRGRCAGCGTPISARYPLIEAASTLITMIVAWQLGATTEALAVIVLSWALIALSVIDYDHQLLPDSITLPFLWLGLLLNLTGMFTDIGSAVIGAAAGYLSLWSIYWLFKLLTGKEGMGHGDFKLLALFGAWLGWQYLLPVVLISSLVGAAIGITLILMRGRDRNLPIPFGPYLAIAGWITLLWGRDLIDSYWWWMGVQ